MDTMDIKAHHTIASVFDSHYKSHIQHKDPFSKFIKYLEFIPVEDLETYVDYSEKYLHKNNLNFFVFDVLVHKDLENTVLTQLEDYFTDVDSLSNHLQGSYFISSEKRCKQDNICVLKCILKSGISRNKKTSCHEWIRDNLEHKMEEWGVISINPYSFLSLFEKVKLYYTYNGECPFVVAEDRFRASMISSTSSSSSAQLADTAVAVETSRCFSSPGLKLSMGIPMATDKAELFSTLQANSHQLGNVGDAGPSRADTISSGTGSHSSSIPSALHRPSISAKVDNIIQHMKFMDYNSCTEPHFIIVGADNHQDRDPYQRYRRYTHAHEYSQHTTKQRDKINEVYKDTFVRRLKKKENANLALTILSTLLYQKLMMILASLTLLNV